MLHNTDMPPQASAERRQEIRASIGRLLREVYDTPDFLPDGLAECLKKLDGQPPQR